LKLSPSPEQLADLKTKHGDLWTLRSSVVDVVVRMPTVDEFNTFATMVMDERQKPHAPRNLLNRCMVWPLLSEYYEALRAKPGVAVKIQSELANLTGLDEEIRVEKA
jgi:hypothetical protein